jgi:hypothetical protein
MHTVETQIPTERASRYLVQLCRHASQISRHRMMRLPAHVTRDQPVRHEMPNQVNAEWSDTHGTISVDGGTCTLRAAEHALILRIEAENDHRLRQLQEMITRNLTRFSRREPLTLNGQPSDGTPPAAEQHGRRKPVILVVVGGLAIAAHMILGGAVLAAPQWTGLAADAIIVIVAVKAAAIGLGYLVHRRRRA